MSDMVLLPSIILNRLGNSAARRKYSARTAAKKSVCSCSNLSGERAPSSLLLGITTYVTTDIAAVPLLASRTAVKVLRP